MDRKNKEEMIQGFIEDARRIITKIEWDNPEFQNLLRKDLERAFKAAKEEVRDFAPLYQSLCRKGADTKLLEALKTALYGMNDYFIEMTFWQSVALTLEKKVRVYEAKLAWENQN